MSINMAKLLFAWIGVASSLPLVGQDLPDMKTSTYRFSEDRGGKPLDKSSLGVHLARALGAIKNCDKKTLEALTFGDKIEVLSVWEGNSGAVVYEIRATSLEFSPSFTGRYDINLHVTQTPIENHPSIPDAPTSFETKCALTIKSVAASGASK